MRRIALLLLLAAMAMPAGGSATPGAFGLDLSRPAQRPVGRPVFEPRAVAIVFPGYGRVTVQPFVQRTTTVRQCGAVLRRNKDRPQRLTTIGIDGSETESCGKLVAVGRVPGPAGHARLVFLYRNQAQFAGATEADAAIRPIIAVTTARGPWQIDDMLSSRLNERGTTTIAAARRQFRRDGSITD